MDTLQILLPIRLLPLAHRKSDRKSHSMHGPSGMVKYIDSMVKYIEKLRIRILRVWSSYTGVYKYEILDKNEHVQVQGRSKLRILKVCSSYLGIYKYEIFDKNEHVQVQGRSNYGYKSLDFSLV